MTVCSNRQIDGEDFINFCGLLRKRELYETNPCFLQNFQSDQTVCLIIHVFCKGYEREIFFVLIYRTGRTISGLQLLQKTNFFFGKYGSVSYSFSCTQWVVNFPSCTILYSIVVPLFTYRAVQCRGDNRVSVQDTNSRWQLKKILLYLDQRSFYIFASQIIW